jgi:hypothetical protein
MDYKTIPWLIGFKNLSLMKIWKEFKKILKKNKKNFNIYLMHLQRNWYLLIKIMKIDYHLKHQ